MWKISLTKVLKNNNFYLYPLLPCPTSLRSAPPPCVLCFALHDTFYFKFLSSFFAGSLFVNALALELESFQ